MANYNSDYNGGNNFGDQSFNNYDQPAYSYQDNAMDREDVTNAISKSYLIMVVALFITAISAYLTINNESLFTSIFAGNGYLILFAIEFGVVIGATKAVSCNNAPIAISLFAVYSIVNGMTLSCIFMVYEMGSIEGIFVMSAVMFGIMSLIGLTTKKNLTSVGMIGIQALVGIIVVGLLNLFIFHSSGVELLLDFVGVIIFVGLTAYDSQKMKQRLASSDGESVNAIAVYFAIQLYLDLINLFLRLLALFGKRR